MQPESRSGSGDHHPQILFCRAHDPEVANPAPATKENPRALKGHFYIGVHQVSLAAGLGFSGRMIVLLMGVSGSGKTTIGREVACTLGWEFYEADDLHPQTNIEKMMHGIPLTDEDREPWLTAVRALIEDLDTAGADAVVACSALKESYRRRLLGDITESAIIYLRGSPELIARRLNNRTGHFMPADLLQSQFDALEEPSSAITIDVHQPVAEIVHEIVAMIRRNGAT